MTDEAKTTIDAICVLAGTEVEWQNWLQEHPAHTRNAHVMPLFYGDSSETILKYGVVMIITTGTFWDRPDSVHLYKTADSRRTRRRHVL